MSGPNQSSKVNDQVAYGTGVDSPEPTGNGQTSTGGWTTTAGLYTFEILDGTPAPLNVQLGGTAGITQVGTKQQWAVSMSLSGSPVQIVANMADAQNHAITAFAPNVFAYTYISRQRFVATVSASGLITATGRGQCEIEVISSRQCMASFPNATPSGTEGVRASLLVTVVA